MVFGFQITTSYSSVEQTNEQKISFKQLDSLKSTNFQVRILTFSKPYKKFYLDDNYN